MKLVAENKSDMTDPNTEGGAKRDDILNFSWWLCMLPFFVAIAIFVFKWQQARAEMHWLVYSMLALVLGLLFTVLVMTASRPEASDQAKSQ